MESGRPTPHIGQRIRRTAQLDSLTSDVLYSRSYKRVIAHLQRTQQVGTVLTFFHDHMQDPPPLEPHWTEHLREHLDPARSWRIYVDGAWRPTPTAALHNYFLDGNANVGSGCILIMASQADWEQAPIIVLPFVADQLDAEHGGSPFLMELLALTGGLQILAHLQLTGQVITDCQSLTRKLAKWDVLRRNTGSPGYPLLRECKRLLTPARTLRWTKGHPERSRSPRSDWSQDQWGNYLADLYAGGGPPAHPDARQPKTSIPQGLASGLSPSSG